MFNKKFLLLLLIFIAWIWIPTGTPDDLLTTVPIIAYFGWKIFIIVTIILLGLLWYFGCFKIIKAMFK